MTLTTAASHGCSVRADHGLQRLHQLRPGDDGIDALMRHRRMAAVAAHGDLEGAGAGHHRPRHHRNFADRNAGPVVQAEHGVDREALEQPVLDHHRRAAFGLLGRLEDEGHAAVEIRVGGQPARGAEQHRRVAVVAAGVHLPGVPRMVGELVHLDQRQGIHVGAQADHARRGAGTHDADDAGAGDAAMHLDPVAFELARHQLGGPLLVEGEFRMRVDVAPESRQLGEERQVEQGYGRWHCRLLHRDYYAAVASPRRLHYAPGNGTRCH